MPPPPPQEPAAAPSPLRSARFITMFAFLCVTFALGQFHRSSGAVMSPVFVDELMLGAEQLGLVIGGMFITQGLMQIPSAVLLDRYGSRNVMPAMTLVAVAGCGLIGIADSWLTILTGRVLLGVGFATTLLGAYPVFVRWGRPEIIATLTGRYLFVGGIGALSATLPLAWVIEVFSWRSVYLALGAATLVSALMTYVVLRDSPNDGAGAGGGARMPAPRATLRGSITGMGEVLADRRIWPVLTIALFLYSPLQVLIGLWAGPFLKDVHQVPALERSYILLAMAVAMNLGMLMFGPIERHFNTRRRVILYATSAICLMFLALALAGYAHLWAAVALFVLIELAAPFFVVVLVHSQVMFPPEYASRVVSLINLLAISGIFVSQYLTGHVIGAVTDDPAVTGSVLGYRLVFALMAAVFGVITLVYRRTRDIPPRG
ncbi:MAG: MFS transporter [Hyphomicrobiales bacterium]|nr:MFS transporter [Hyphomicrobiales bacterium]